MKHTEFLVLVVAISLVSFGGYTLWINLGVLHFPNYARWAGGVGLPMCVAGTLIRLYQLRRALEKTG